MALPSFSHSSFFHGVELDSDSFKYFHSRVKSMVAEDIALVRDRYELSNTDFEAKFDSWADLVNFLESHNTCISKFKFVANFHYTKDDDQRYLSYSFNDGQNHFYMSTSNSGWMIRAKNDFETLIQKYKKPYSLYIKSGTSKFPITKVVFVNVIFVIFVMFWSNFTSNFGSMGTSFIIYIFGSILAYMGILQFCKTKFMVRFFATNNLTFTK